MIRDLINVPIIPVLAIENMEHVEPLGEALIENGLTCLEITLRSEIAPDAIRLLRKKFPMAVIGAGTVNRPEDVDRAIDAGAQFGVSPGSTPALRKRVHKKDFPFLPGAATPSEMMVLQEEGFLCQKFFPAEAMGGSKTLKSVYGPLPQISFCATGGISDRNLSEYLVLPNIIAIGGSWMAPKNLIETANWSEIGKRSRLALEAIGR